MSVCRFCRHELPAGAKFCPECGESTGEPGGSRGSPRQGPEIFSLQGDRLPALPTDDFDEIFAKTTATEMACTIEPTGGLHAEADYLLQVSSSGELLGWELNRPYFSIGREGAKIELADRYVAQRHLAVARIGPVWLVINRATHKRMRVGGRDLRQKTLRPGDVLRIGRTWLVFAGGRPTVSPKLPRAMEGRWREIPSVGSKFDERLQRAAEDPLDSIFGPEPEAELMLIIESETAATSTGRPILIGSHPVCDVVLRGEGIGPVHCLLNWLPDGLRLFDLETGKKTRLDGAPVVESPVAHGQTIDVAGETLSVRLMGDPTAPAKILAPPSTPALAASVIYGPHAGEIAALPLRKKLTLGRSHEADLSLPDARRISRRQVQLEAVQTNDEDSPGPFVELLELDSRLRVLVNRQPLEGGAGRAAPGDCIQFDTGEGVASTALFIHYDLGRDAW